MHRDTILYSPTQYSQHSHHSKHSQHSQHLHPAHRRLLEPHRTTTATVVAVAEDAGGMADIAKLPAEEPRRRSEWRWQAIRRFQMDESEVDFHQVTLLANRLNDIINLCVRDNDMFGMCHAMAKTMVWSVKTMERFHLPIERALLDTQPIPVVYVTDGCNDADSVWYQAAAIPKNPVDPRAMRDRIQELHRLAAQALMERRPVDDTYFALNDAFVLDFFKAVVLTMPFRNRDYRHIELGNNAVMKQFIRMVHVAREEIGASSSGCRNSKLCILL